MSPKQTPKGQVFECNQDHGDCLNDRGYPSSVWPKRGGQSYPPARRPAPAPRRNSSGGGFGGRSPETQARIERQHSQEMALRYFAMKGSALPGTTELREMISWFQRDIARSPERRQEREPDPEPPEDIGGVSEPAEYGDGPPPDEPPF